MPACVVMGVLNVTPDSFSDGGRFADTPGAVARARTMLDQGARIVDVGGESTRPGAPPVPVEVEIDRVVPVVEQVAPMAAAAGARVSVDTRHAEVARAAVGAGASILNDVSASLEDVAADLGVGWIAMHMQGEPGTMQDDPHYDDVVEEVLAFLVEAEHRGRAAGVAEVWIDPGIGFGKTFDHNWRLLGATDRFVATGIPVVVGASRKGFLGEELRRSDRVGVVPGPGDRLEASVAVAAFVAGRGAAVVRAHDVAETVAAVGGVASGSRSAVAAGTVSGGAA